MPRKKATKPIQSVNWAPAKTPEAKEKQMISRAMDLAEQQLMDGTASSQVIVHFLKLASSREKLEKNKLIQENELLKAKAEAIKAQENTEKLYKEAIDAMRLYSGNYEDD